MPEPELWQRVERVLDAALTCETAEWPALLDQQCSGDPELRRQVEALLARLDTAREFLASPPANAAAAVLAEARAAAAAGEASAAPAPAPEGRRIGAWRILRELGRGGMSRVFLAERADGQFAQRVALKLLRPGLDSDLDQERFRAERQILARLSHPNVARLLDGGVTDEGLPYLVLEYIDGEPIDRYCDRNALPVARRVQLFATVADAVQYAHRNLVIHRDLKPSNILVTADGTVKLLDFGLAKLLDAEASAFAPPRTRTGFRLMTPEYAAPEQILGDAVTTLTDVYQLGAVLYQLLTGQLPFGRRGSLRALEQAVLRESPPLPSAAAAGAAPLRGDLDAIVMMAMRKEPERRYASAAALLEDLQRWREGRPVVARPDSAGYRAGKFVARHRGAAAGAALIALLLAGAGVRERTLRSRAEAQAHTATAVESYLESVFNVADPFAPPTEHGTDVTARALLDRGAARIDSVLAGQPGVQSELRRVFGHVYADLGLYDRAAPVLQRALEQRRALYGPRHPAVAEAMDALGQVLLAQDRLDGAEPLLRGALQQRRELLGARDTATAASLEHLATLLQQRSDYAAAEPLFREALATRRAALGAGDLSVATTEVDLGVLLFEKGDYDGAEHAYRSALAIQERALGPNHIQTAETLHNLAGVEEMRGRYPQAEALYRRALDIKRRAIGDLHPTVTVNLNNLGGLISRDDRRLDEAESLLRQALSLDRRMFGERHDYVAEDERKLGQVLRRKGDFDEALVLVRQALATDRALYGDKQGYVAANLNILGSVLDLKGDLDGAVAALRESQAQYGRFVGQNHLNFIVVSMNLARALRERGDTAEAARLYRAAAARLDTTKTPARNQLINAQIGLGRVLMAEGRTVEARPVLERALEASRRASPHSDAQLGEALLALGQCLAASGEGARAEPLLRQADAVLAHVARGQPRLVADTRAALARLHRRA